MRRVLLLMALSVGLVLPIAGVGAPAAPAGAVPAAVATPTQATPPTGLLELLAPTGRLVCSTAFSLASGLEAIGFVVPPAVVDLAALRQQLTPVLITCSQTFPPVVDDPVRCATGSLLGPLQSYVSVPDIVAALLDQLGTLGTALEAVLGIRVDEPLRTLIANAASCEVVESGGLIEPPPAFPRPTPSTTAPSPTTGTPTTATATGPIRTGTVLAAPAARPVTAAPVPAPRTDAVGSTIARLIPIDVLAIAGRDRILAAGAMAIVGGALANQLGARRRPRPTRGRSGHPHLPSPPAEGPNP